MLPQVTIRIAAEPGGRDVHASIVDPPVRLPEGFPIAPNQVTVLPRANGTGIYDVLAWLSETDWPNVADVLHTIRRGTFRVGMPYPVEWQRIDTDSRLILIHPRGLLRHPEEYYESWADKAVVLPICPTNREAHAQLPFVSPEWGRPMCAMLWQQDVRLGYPLAVRGEPNDPRLVIRRMPSGVEYVAMRAPEGANEEAEPAIVARLVMHSIEIETRDDPEYDSEHEYLAEQARQSGLPVRFQEISITS